MRYYHGSRNGHLKKLTMDKAKHGYIYMAEDYAFALLYAACSVRFWDFDHKEQKLIIREVCDNCFEKMYKGVKCYIYSAEKVKDYEPDFYNGRRSIKMKHDVELESVEIIPDAYKKIMELAAAGKLKLKYWHEHTKEEKEKQNALMEKLFLNKNTMKMLKEKYPEDYSVFVKLFPNKAVD